MKYHPRAKIRASSMCLRRSWVTRLLAFPGYTGTAVGPIPGALAPPSFPGVRIYTSMLVSGRRPANVAAPPDDTIFCCGNGLLYVLRQGLGLYCNCLLVVREMPFQNYQIVGGSRSDDLFLSSVERFFHVSYTPYLVVFFLNLERCIYEQILETFNFLEPI